MELKLAKNGERISTVLNVIWIELFKGQIIRYKLNTHIRAD